jgi:hypothetical protein
MITYNCDFAAELVLDLTGLDCIWRMLLDELVQVLDTHLGDLSSSMYQASLWSMFALTTATVGGWK